MTPRPVAAGSVPASGPAAFATRWLLLSAVVLGVLTMHHVAAPDGAMPGGSMASMAQAGSTHAAEIHAAEIHAGEVAAPAGMDSAMHSMLHLCLAVLLAVAGLLLVVAFVWWAGSGRPAAAGRPGAAGGARPPPWRSGRELLTASCVLRI